MEACAQMPLDTGCRNLTEAEFERVSAMVKGLAGINLHVGKRELVKARLGKIVRRMGFATFGEYLDSVEADKSGRALVHMLDILSTNQTSFFREPKHFEHFARYVRGRKRIRVWSAGCSSGEEPYTIAMTILDNQPDAADVDAKILATDLSTRCLASARDGYFPRAKAESVPAQIRAKYMEYVSGRREDRLYRIKPEVRALVSFARLNLLEDWPMAGPFDAIFCRNVMIYFDKPTQQKIIGRFHGILARGGVLYIGHSESLAGVRHGFGYVQPTVYVKE